MKRICSIPDCWFPHSQKGFCVWHFRRTPEFRARNIAQQCARRADPVKHERDRALDRARRATPERKAETQRRNRQAYLRYRADPVKREAIRTANREAMRVILASPEKNAARKAYQREWLADPEHRASVNESIRRWRRAVQADPERREAKNARQRARYARLGGQGYQRMRGYLHTAQAGLCGRCAKPIKATGQESHVDHVVSEIRGGTSALWNLQLLCPQCNLSKHDSPPERSEIAAAQARALDWGAVALGIDG